MNYVMPIDITANKIICIALIKSYKMNRVRIHKILWVNQSVAYIARASDENIINELEDDYYRVDDLYTDEKIIKTIFEYEGLKW